MFTNHIYLIYMYKPDLALINLQWLICHKTKQNQTNTYTQICKYRLMQIHTYIHKYVSTHTHMYTHTCVHTHTYTYTHIYTSASFIIPQVKTSNKEFLN